MKAFLASPWIGKVVIFSARRMHSDSGEIKNVISVYWMIRIHEQTIHKIECAIAN